ncbi:MAG: hypothetical protein KKA42_04870, partial [candidate division Zixibacteria bacterium]|nr:hypothetical protein [candidate division Zixibacteria bacterium]
MLRPIGTCLACLTVILAVVPGTPFAATVSLVADSSTSRLPAGCMFIFDRSDSLFINGALIPGPGSRFVVGSGYFDVSDLSFRTGDTLRAVFRPVPRWLQKSYGRPLPPVAEEHTSLPPPESYAPPGVTRSTGSDLRLTGAKSFRFNARSAGASDFGQSLDLSIAGELSPGIELSGSISDRGYDPSYGTADSRLSELDKINLMLKSPRLMAQVGDITLGRRGEAGKSVTGASFDLSYPVWGGRAAAARPKGVYRTFRGFGRDGFQGPYQIGDGSAAGPIVPGSETVWLDGARLERGADKDYTVDYPVGRVTFTALHPIDDRSRIEVDYEPQSTDFKKELLSAGAHAQLADSILYLDIETVREGDDRDNPETGELSATDLTVLKAVGDSAAYRSGVTPDTSGSYVVLVDSLPDTVYAYVGPEVGDLSVRFSFVGSGKGEYRYAGGDRYEFAGENNGEYLPIVLIAAPSRNDYHRALLGSSSPLLGKLTLDMRASSYDANLWSGIDDSDNDAVFYRLKAERHWTKQRATLRAERRVREYGFRARDRIDSADFRRDFFLPEDYSISADETVHRVEGLLTPISGLELKASYRDLSYDDSFESRTGGGGVTVRIGHAFDAGADWRSISSTLRPTSLSGKGSASIVSSFVRVSPLATWWLVGRLESDGRENEYADTPRGTRYLRTEAAVEGTRETVRWERFVEDSLIGEWAEVLTRDRLTAVTRRGFGQLTCDVTATYQWLDRPAGREETFLGRTDVRYRDSQRKLTVGSFYSVSEERRNARGITYLEVEPGLGSFILEDGAYVPDPDGNYIEVEELLSDVARVRRAERSFSLSK